MKVEKSYRAAALRWLLPLVALTLVGCGGDDDDEPAPQPVIPAIASFNATSTVITAGTGTSVTATFSNGTGVVNNGVGAVTSGTQTPYLKKAIGMAYLPTAQATLDSVFDVDIRGRRARARVVPMPFYKRAA